MEYPEGEPLIQSEERENAAPSAPAESHGGAGRGGGGGGAGAGGPRPRTQTGKRPAVKPVKTKAKKHKRSRVSRSSQVNYTVQEGEDMLLVISSSTAHNDGSAWTPPRKSTKKRKLTKGKLKKTQVKKKKPTRTKPKVEKNLCDREKEERSLCVGRFSTDHRWGEALPEEVLIKIFQMVVIHDGAVPFLCRVGRVCRLWHSAASSPVLWRKLTLGHCWIAPGKSQLPKTEQKIKDTVNWLAQNRLTQLRDFSLDHWKKNVGYALDVVAQSCPHLRSLTLSNCTGLSGNGFNMLGLHSRFLQSINLQYSEFQVEGILEYLENHGNQIKQFLFTHGLKNDRLLSAITRGCCPDLELLEVNTMLDSKDCELPVYIQALQMACPKLKTFRMLNVRPLHKTTRTAADSMLGFPLLEELCIATTSFSYMTDKDLWDILFGSPKLRVLDLRGCSRITPSGLAALPCQELECLFWGQYFSSSVALSTPKAGLHMLTRKWCLTLQELDIGNQLFTAEDLEAAMGHLSQAAEAETLRSLNLSGTRITPPALRLVVGKSTALKYLNLSSCRYLPRGLKRIYRCQEDICHLLDKLQ